MDKNRYPIGHKKYGEMGPMTQKEAMNMPMANRTIHRLTKKFKQLPVMDVEMEKNGKKKMIYKPGNQ